MKSIYLDSDTTAIIPDTWTAELAGATLSIYEANNGVGAFQLTSFKAPNKDSIDLSKELLSLLYDKYEDADIKEKANYVFFETIDKDSVFWKYWLINGKESIFFISYNCQASDKGIENQVIDSIINSIIRYYLFIQKLLLPGHLKSRAYCCYLPQAPLSVQAADRSGFSANRV